MRISAETARVLITVKTTPMPSRKYGDTVCVAGVRLDAERPSWVRLYPIAFRWLEPASQFKKYDIVEVEIRRRDADSRFESFSPTESSFRVVGHLDDWTDRDPVLKDLPRTSTCALRSAKVHNAPSLGMVPVRSIDGVRFEPHPGWTPAEEARIAASFDLEQPALFGSRKAPPKLVAPRFKFGYRYHCMADACPGHGGQLLDWELTEFQRRQQGRSDEELKEQVVARFRQMMFAEKRETSFFMGNFEDPKKRHNFSVLGVYYPRRKPLALFDLDG